MQDGIFAATVTLNKTSMIQMKYGEQLLVYEIYAIFSWHALKWLINFVYMFHGGFFIISYI